MGNDNKQSYSHLWGTLPKSLGACENVNKKHILLILLLVDCGNGPTDFKSWKDTNRTERTWKGHVTWKKRKWMHMLRNEMIRQAMTTNQKLFQKGWKTLVSATTPLRIVFLGSYRRTPLSRNKKKVCGFWGIFHLKWPDRKIDKDMERHEGKGHESNWKDMSEQVSKWIERKGKGRGNEKRLPPKSLNPLYPKP